MPQPFQRPIGLQVSDTAKVVSRSFEQALAEAGGSLPTWLVLLSLRSGRGNTQRELAEAVGIRGATLSHHLDGLEKAGLVARRADPHNRRIQRVELTTEGEQAFDRLRKVAVGFDRRLRDGIAEDEVESLRSLLERLRENVAE
jgi:MarR family transcriptional regulator for hemolysin